MAVKGSATVTLTSYRDTQSVTRYYKLQPAGSSAPSKPTTKPPSSDWTDLEPDCDISKELYFCDLTIFSNGEGEYSKVSKSTSYEAAKQAYNKAQAAKDGIDNLEIGGRNLLRNSKNLKSFTNESPTYISMTFTDADVTVIATKSVLGIYYDISVEGASDYTLSFNAADISGLCEYSVGGNTAIWSGLVPYSIMKEGRTEVTFKTYDTTTKCRIYFSCHSGNDSFRLWNVKLEKGNKATDWTPAPEDVDAGIASAAESKAEVINSKGEQLVINGNAILGNNTNFTQWLYDGSMANGSGGSFTLSPGIRKYMFNDRFFGLDLSKDYRFEFDAISKDSTSRHYSMLAFYDIDKKEITALNHMYISEVTELAADLKDGDTVVYLNDISSFKINTGTATYKRGFIFWNYTNSFGYKYPPKTYSRNVFYNLWEDSGVNKADNTITLKSP